MAKIQRKIQKIFGASAGNDQLAAFGTMVSGSPLYTDDLELLQTDKYTQGWGAAVATNNASFMEEMNGVQYGFSKQIAYVLQQGIPEWDENTTYYATTSWVQVAGVFYQSLTDDNTGNNPVSDSENWKEWRFIDIATDEQAESGEVENVAVNPRQMREAINEALIGALQYKGEWIATDQTDYSSIELPVKAGYMYYVTGSATIDGIEWNTGDYLIINEDVAIGETITNVQEIDNTESSDIVRLDAEQTITNKTIDANNNTLLNLTKANFKPGIAFDTSRNIGEIVQSALPLTDSGLHLLDGTLLQGDGIYADFVKYIAELYSANPTAIYFTDETTWQNTVATYGSCGKFVYNEDDNTVRLPKVSNILQCTTDLSALGDLIEAGLPALNQTNTTVQPQTVKTLIYIVVATSAKTDIQVDIDNIATDINNKADRDGSNMVSSVKNFDGQWVAGYTQFLVDVRLPVGAAVLLGTYDLSSYLPNDGYAYEVCVDVFVYTGSANGAYANVWAAGTNGVASAGTGTITRAANFVVAIGRSNLVINADRKLNIYYSASGEA